MDEFEVADEPPLVLTPHEVKLVKALRAKPDRVDSWVARGDPMANHSKLLGLYTRFFEAANAAGLEYWLEYGSVLGYIRHGGMVPWEWDMDIGVTSASMRKLVSLGEQLTAGDGEYGFKYRTDAGYATPVYCFYLKGCEECACDIAEYEEVGEELVCAAADWGYPSHARGDILPPRAVCMLGQLAYIPAKPENFLSRGHTGPAEAGAIEPLPYSEYDPVPFLLSHLYHPELLEKVCGPPVTDVPVARSIAEGFEIYARAGSPFVVRGVAAFDFNVVPFHARMRAEGLKTFAWDKKMEEVKDIPVASALDDWAAGRLQVNFVDSPIPKMVLNEGIHADLRAIGLNEDRLMLVLSNKGTYTPFHQDPIAGKESGGGWMWLQAGIKVWNFLGQEHTDDIFDTGANSVGDPLAADLLTARGGALWGKVSAVVARGGDFVYFPPGTNHRVWTWEDSVGIGGYARFEFDDERVAAGCAWYDSKGINPAHGMFQVVARQKAEAYIAAHGEASKH